MQSSRGCINVLPLCTANKYFTFLFHRSSFWLYFGIIIWKKFHARLLYLSFFHANYSLDKKKKSFLTFNFEALKSILNSVTKMNLKWAKKWTRNGSEIEQKMSRIWPEMSQKLSKNVTKMDKIGKLSQRWAKIGPKWTKT